MEIERTRTMTKEFWVSALIRAIRTICQTAIATIGTAMVLSEVPWMYVASASVLAGILSILTSIATGLPEVELQQTLYSLDNIIDEEEEEEEEPEDMDEEGDEDGTAEC